MGSACARGMKLFLCFSWDDILQLSKSIFRLIKKFLAFFENVENFRPIIFYNQNIDTTPLSSMRTAV